MDLDYLSKIDSKENLIKYIDYIVMVVLESDE